MIVIKLFQKAVKLGKHMFEPVYKQMSPEELVSNFNKHEILALIKHADNSKDYETLSKLYDFFKHGDGKSYMSLPKKHFLTLKEGSTIKWLDTAKETEIINHIDFHMRNNNTKSLEMIQRAIEKKKMTGDVFFGDIYFEVEHFLDNAKHIADHLS